MNPSLMLLLWKECVNNDVQQFQSQDTKLNKDMMSLNLKLFQWYYKSYKTYCTYTESEFKIIPMILQELHIPSLNLK
jgi:hypothetical protein